MDVLDDELQAFFHRLERILGKRECHGNSPCRLLNLPADTGPYSANRIQSSAILFHSKLEMLPF